MDYKELGLKCGLEIHQQLEGKKLFCSCPTTIRDDEPDFILHRRLRAAAGEEGEVDIAAKQEHLRGKTFAYQGYYDSTCLVETDCEPPHEINPKAMTAALQLCKIVDAEVFPIIQVMRKTIIDGSNTSGFQRTALVARDGVIKTTGGAIRITNISLEEDSCKIISENTEEKAYSLDRLGIPLIEIGTAPDITSPEQCQEAAKKIGMLLRSLPTVKRGLGTIRQDVNVSIKGGTRIEIKGAQDLRQLPLLVELEVKRQQELLKIKDELKKVKLPGVIDVTFLFTNSAANVIKSALAKKNGAVIAIKLPGFAGFIGREVQPGRRLGTEFSDRAKVRAGVGGIFHSDELPRYGISESEVGKVKEKLSCKPEDAFVLIVDMEKKARSALEAVYERAQEALKGIPAEVRKANADGTTTYLRPIPGAARMYPETDVPLIRPDLRSIQLPELLEEKIMRYQKDWGLSKDLAEFTAKSELVHLFEELVKQYPNVKPAFIAEILTSTPLDIKRQYHHEPDKLTEDNFRDVFRYLADGKIHKDIVLDVLIDMITDKFDVKRYATMGTEEIHKELLKIVAEHKGAPFSALMGLAMKKLGGKASGQFISEQLRKILEKGH